MTLDGRRAELRSGSSWWAVERVRSASAVLLGALEGISALRCSRWATARRLRWRSGRAASTSTTRTIRRWRLLLSRSDVAASALPAPEPLRPAMRPSALGNRCATAFAACPGGGSCERTLNPAKTDSRVRADRCQRRQGVSSQPAPVAGSSQTLVVQCIADECSRTRGSALPPQAYAQSDARGGRRSSLLELRSRRHKPHSGWRFHAPLDVHAREPPFEPVGQPPRALPE
jgi:hypothetical protein